jgi:hypothetical protein
MLSYGFCSFRNFCWNETIDCGVCEQSLSDERDFCDRRVRRVDRIFMIDEHGDRRNVAVSPN